MQKTLAIAGALLLIGAFSIAFTADVGQCVDPVNPGDQLIIPLGVDVNLSEHMVIHLIQLTISNVTYGGAYSPNPENSVWPVITFQYENLGMSQVRGRLHLQIVDNSSAVPSGWTYDKVDYTIPQPIGPGQKSSPVTLEFAMPKGRRVSKLIVIDDNVVKQTAAEIPIVYPTHVPGSTTTGAPVGSPGDDSWRNLLIIPILLGIVGLVGWLMARKRLF